MCNFLIGNVTQTFVLFFQKDESSCFKEEQTKHSFRISYHWPDKSRFLTAIFKWHDE